MSAGQPAALASTDRDAGSTGDRKIRARSDWQPIETAPRDGTPIDVWVPGEFAQRWCDVVWAKSSHQCISQYCDSCPPRMNVKGWRDPLSDELMIGQLAPSHWMPHPAPPAQSSVPR